MRRRAADFRRPVRKRIPNWIWALLGLFFFAGIFLFVVQHNHDQNLVLQSTLEKDEKPEPVRKASNYAEELLTPRSVARQVADQITLAKAYVIIAKEHNNLQLAWELGQNIRSCQLILSRAAMTGRLLSLDEAGPLIETMSSLIFKAQDAHYDVATTMMTMKSHIQALEERAHAATVQATLFAELAAEEIPRSLHCLNVKLTADWLMKRVEENRKSKSNSRWLADNSLNHFCVFSDNLAAVSVVVNSTVSNAGRPDTLVFHVITNDVSYGPMQAWFLSNDFQGAAIDLQNIRHITRLNSSGGSHQTRLNHLRFYIPDIYPKLDKVVFLDDDVVVQKDLTPLFSLDLHGSVNGAVETCLESHHRFYKYLNFSNPIIGSKFDPQACGWAFGMNVFDLVAWRRANVTGLYRYWMDQNRDGLLWRPLRTLPPGLLSFYGLTHPLDRRWHVLGLGYDLNVDPRLVENAAVVHFNGNMKPWLKLAIGKYRPLWDRYFNGSHTYIQECVRN